MDESLQLNALKYGGIRLRGQFIQGSNYTFLVDCVHKGESQPCVYKPAKGQAPLWDFDSSSLPKREVAAFMLSTYSGWNFVPSTVFRRSGLPYGPGSLQVFIQHNPEDHYFSLPSALKKQLADIALFDLVCNNADRKGGHLILDENGKIWAIDHALCFHSEVKLRTVIWDFAGQGFSAELVLKLKCIKQGLDEGCALERSLARLLSRLEIAALAERVEKLLLNPRFPEPDSNRRIFPWPPL